MQHREPDPDPDHDSNPAPDLAYIAIQLEEARAAARTLYELYPDPSQVEPLYRALMDALAEIAGETNKEAARTYHP
jgi:hypothetical protein